MSDRPNALRLAAWLGIVVLTMYAVLLGGTYGGINSHVLRVLSTVLVAAVLAVWLLAAVREPAWRPRSVLWPAILACLVAFLLSSALSWDPRLSLEYTAYAVLLTGLYLLAVRLMGDTPFRDRIGALAFLLCTVVCVGYLVRVGLWWVEWWGLIGRIAVPPLRPRLEGLTFQTPNVVATVSVLLFAVAAAQTGWATRGRRVALTVLGMLVAAVVVITASRGAWAGVAAGVVALGAVWLADAGNRRSLRDQLARPRGALLAGAAVAALLAVTATLGPRLLARFTAGGEDLRLGYILSALRMFAERPLTGSGPGTWVVRRAAFTEPDEIDLYVPHAHDLYAQAIGEFGLLGIVAGALLLGGLAWLVIGALRDADQLRRRYGLATLFALVFLGTQQVVDFFANLPAVLLPLALLVATLDGTSERPFLAGRLPTWRVPALAPVATLALAGVVALGVLGWSESVAARHEAALGVLARGDTGRAAEASASVAAADPTLGVYQLTAGLAAERAGLPGAGAAFRAAAERDDLAESWLDAAAVAAAGGARSEAALALERALRLGVQRPTVSFPAAALWLELGEVDRARETFVTAVAGTPSLGVDPYWRSSPQLAALQPSVVAGALDRGSPMTRWELALLTEDPSEPARRALLQPAVRAVTDLVARTWRGDEAARTALSQLALDAPTDPLAVAWCGRLAARAGDTATATRFRRWLEIVDPVLAVSLSHDRRVVSSAEPASLDNLAVGYGPATYRRSAPGDLLASRLPRVVVGP